MSSVAVITSSTELVLVRFGCSCLLADLVVGFDYLLEAVRGPLVGLVLLTRRLLVVIGCLRLLEHTRLVDA